MSVSVPEKRKDRERNRWTEADTEIVVRYRREEQ